MILPHKHLALSESIFGLGSFLIQFMTIPISLEDLWKKFNDLKKTELSLTIHNFDNFMLALDYLYLIGAIKHDKEGRIILCD